MYGNSLKLAKFELSLCMTRLIILFMNLCGNNSELENKKTWVAMQSVEYDHRNDLMAKDPMIINNVSNSGINVMGMRSLDGEKAFVWIALSVL